MLSHSYRVRFASVPTLGLALSLLVAAGACQTETRQRGSCDSTADCASPTECVAGVCADSSESNDAGIAPDLDDAVVGPTCESHLAQCDDDTWSNSEFYCDLDQGRCLQKCAHANRLRSDDCPNSNLCDGHLRGVNSALALDGFCIPANCDAETNTGCSGGDTCVPVANGAAFCFESGALTIGAACATRGSEQQRCAPGLLCVDGACATTCIESCSGVDCVPVFGDSFAPLGVCAYPCEPSEECGGLCSPVFWFQALSRWLCFEEQDPAALGETCSGARRCGEGLHCTNNENDQYGSCERLCSPPSSDTVGLGGCEEPLACVALAGGELGLCRERCEPYPRSGTSGGYGCQDPEATCLPLAAADFASAPWGLCSPDNGRVAPGQACGTPNTLGNECVDYGFCVEWGACLPLCEPLSTGQCDAYPELYCSGGIPLRGRLDLSVCAFSNALVGVGEECATEFVGLTCIDDSSICLDLDGVPECYRVCRAAVPSDCPEGQRCRSEGLEPDLAAPWMGVCDE